MGLNLTHLVAPLASLLESEKTEKYWKDKATSELDGALRGEILNRNKAKNAILFIADGMGMSTQTAGRIYKAQKLKKGGAEIMLDMDRLPHVGLSKTYSVDLQIPDEAATATALLCGIKTRSNVIAMNAGAYHKNCLSGKGKEVQSVLKDAYLEGKSTGIVTTRRVVDPTVAAAYAHSVSSDWYSDASMSSSVKSSGCKDLATQLYEATEMLTVVLGGGRKYMYPNTSADLEYPSITSDRTDGKDLVAMWRDRTKKAGLTPQYVWNLEDFDTIDIANTDRLLGLFEPTDMRYESDRGLDDAGEPSIAQMTETAIKMLQKNDKGYFLLVEGGRIDDGHHSNSAYKALDDLAAFDEAIGKAVELTSPEDTLIIVTGDHSHVFTIGGGAERGNNILGIAPSQTNPHVALDKASMTTALYSNGPGFHGYFKDGDDTLPETSVAVPRIDPAAVDTTDPKYRQQTAVPLEFGTHAGEDVPILAGGPMAHLFHGVHEQHYIAHVIRYALCLDQEKNHCEKGYKSPGIVDYLGSRLYVSDAVRILKIQFALLITLAALLLLSLIVICKLYWGKRKATPRRRTSETALHPHEQIRNVNHTGSLTLRERNVQPTAHTGPELNHSSFQSTIPKADPKSSYHNQSFQYGERLTAVPEITKQYPQQT